MLWASESMNFSKWRPHNAVKREGTALNSIDNSRGPLCKEKIRRRLAMAKSTMINKTLTDLVRQRNNITNAIKTILILSCTCNNENTYRTVP